MSVRVSARSTLHFAKKEVYDAGHRYADWLIIKNSTKRKKLVYTEKSSHTLYYATKTKYVTKSSTYSHVVDKWTTGNI